MHVQSNLCHDAVFMLILVGADMARVAKPASHQGHMDSTMVLVNQVAASSAMNLPVSGGI